MFNAERYFEQIFALCIRGESDLHDYQKEAVDWLYERPFSALFIDTGMGKTVISSTLLDRLFLEGFDGKILIVAPIRVANRVWMQEYKLWRHLAYFRPSLLRIDDADPGLTGLKGADKTTKKSRLRLLALNSPSPVHVINQEAIPWLVSQYVEVKAKGKLREIARWPYSVVIYDESSRLRDHNSEGFKALKRVLHRIERFHELTATPASQTYMHLFAQIWLLDKGERLGKNITTFRENYFIANPYARTYRLRDGGAEQIEKKIADICLVMRRVKNHIIRIRSIDLPKEAIKRYRNFERDSILELSEDDLIEASTAAVLSNKLLQFASGAVYDADKKYHVVHDEKIEELKQLVQEIVDQPIMVAYWYKSSLDRLRKAFPEARVMDKEGTLEAEWNKGRVKMMLVHPRGVAHGMNLQFGGHHIVLFDIFWPLELFSQLIDRLDRPGQVHTVMVHLLSARRTHDEVVATNLEQLRSAEEAMFKRLQRIRKRLRERELDL